MEEVHILTKRKLRRRFKKALNDTSLANISKSVLNEMSETVVEKSSFSNNFIPFNHERDGLGRIIRTQNAASSKSLFSKKVKVQVKRRVESKKNLLKCPVSDTAPSVGAYNITPSWIKKSFVNPNFSHKVLLKQQETPIEKKLVVLTEVNETIAAKTNKSETNLIKNRIKIPPRKKGIWEDIIIHKIPNNLQYKSIVESKKIVEECGTSIKSCINKMRGDLHSLQKYLK